MPEVKEEGDENKDEEEEKVMDAKKVITLEDILKGNVGEHKEGMHNGENGMKLEEEEAENEAK